MRAKFAGSYEVTKTTSKCQSGGGKNVCGKQRQSVQSSRSDERQRWKEWMMVNKQETEDVR